MELHTLFNIDDPVCLYCYARCDVFETSIGYPALVIDEYSCQQCQEKYEIHHLDNKYLGFSFTCKDLRVFHNYHINKFGIDKIKSAFRQDYIWIPYFDVDFVNKEDLFNKLKTYILFN